jgi:hypothetical protein
VDRRRHGYQSSEVRAVYGRENSIPVAYGRSAQPKIIFVKQVFDPKCARSYVIVLYSGDFILKADLRVPQVLRDWKRCWL